MQRRLWLAVMAALCAAEPAAARNVILFVPDGLRAGIVTPDVAPTMSEVRDHGVNFANSHSMFPTFTLPNASAFATGHAIGDTGMFGNTMYMVTPVPALPGPPTVTPFFENDFALRAETGPAHPQGLLEPETLLVAARRAGLSTAAVGKIGPVGLQDITSLAGRASFMIDDATGHALDLGNGPIEDTAVPPDLAPAIAARVGDVVAPGRGENGQSGDCDRHGTRAANETQIRWFADVTTNVILPRFKAQGKPFFLVFWSRDPDGTQHNEGDSFGTLTPGINGETSLRAIGNADDALRQIRRALVRLGLDRDTDIIVAADHGFSTIAKESKTSAAPRIGCAGDAHALPVGFVAIDLARALNLPLADPDRADAPFDPAKGELALRGNAILGPDPSKPEAVVVVNGGSDTIYLPQNDRGQLARKIVDVLLGEDYVSGLFVDDALGKIPGTLPMSAIGWKGSALTVQPAILVNFRSFSTDCGRDALLCAAEVADTTLIQGQGMHGSFSRADTKNFMAAIGPDFRERYNDAAPASNADVGVTIAQVLGLKLQSKGHLNGRVLTEAFNGGAPVDFAPVMLRSPAAANGLVTELDGQKLGSMVYFDAAGFPGRTVGLGASDNSQSGASSRR